MKTANYSLITMRPSLERLDVLCIGTAVLSETEWEIYTVPDARKFLSLDPGFNFSVVSSLASALKRFFSQCGSLREARELLSNNRSTVVLHEFEGVFGYQTESDFQGQISAILAESVLPVGPALKLLKRKSKPRIRTQLRKQFESMGLLGKATDGIETRKVIPNYPVSVAHGLVAEFAIKNGVMSFTETLDFEVAEEGVRNRIFEAQAKCLVMKTAVETYPDSSRHIVVAGSMLSKASRSIDLLSSVGQIYALESSQDMANYFRSIEHSAHHIG